jgi:hypothetical protein
MAETSARNEAFLKQLERQRLSKPCIRTIDLRGKVPGECQTYEFGGKRHYLDDRAYLLVKQLLQRFDGRYTVGVYEGLQKALKKLSEINNDTSITEEDKPILFRDKNRVQFMRFDEEVRRKEPRLTVVTPVQISIGDVIYHGSTIDITTSAIRVALKRAFTLNSGVEVSVNLSEVTEKSGIEAFSKVKYKILRANHDELRTQLVLLRNRHDDPQITQWLDNWITRKQAPIHMDLNNDLYNLSNRIYARLFTENISKPLIWLTPEGKIHTLHLSVSASQHLSAIKNDDGVFEFAKLALHQIPLNSKQTVLALSNEGYRLADSQDQEQLKQLFAWKAQKKEGYLLLLNQSVLKLDEKTLKKFSEELDALNTYSADYADTFKHSVLQQPRVFSVTDISQCAYLTDVHSSPAELLRFETLEELKAPMPSVIRQFIERKVERYAIKTDIRLRIEGKIYNLKTNDASETGIGVTIPEYLDVIPETRANIDFSRWQDMAKNIRLREIQFRVKYISYWQGETILGLERETRACAASVNTFFADVINLNKEKLSLQSEHLRIAPESIIFSHLISPELTTTPFYLTMDDANVRIIQAVASTANNNAANKKGHWNAMQRQLRSLWDQAKLFADKPDNTLNFTLYSYLNSQQEWQIKQEIDFTSAAEKTLFINQALMSPEHYFYHGSLTSLKTEQVTQQKDLYDKLMELRTHSQHKVKQIRQVFHTMFAIGEFTDITDIIRAAYR